MNTQKLDEISARYAGNNLAKQFRVFWKDAQGQQHERPFRAITTGGAVDRIVYIRDQKDTEVKVANNYGAVFCSLKDK